MFHNANAICKAVFGNCEWFHFGLGNACWCAQTVGLMKTGLDFNTFFKPGMKNKDCTAAFPYEYATKPIRAGFGGGSCNGHAC
jgi:hypothetical protein